MADKASPVFVQDFATLQSLAAEMRGIPRAGVDTESNSLHAYRERVCLIQISTSERDILIDPLAVADLSPLRSFFEDEGVEKIFHAAEYDLLCLRRDFGFRIRGLFDTYAAARSLGIRACGLNALLEREFGITLDKAMQRANWGRRPLTARQLEYARQDTRHLPALRDRLAAQVDSAGFTEELLDECRRLEGIPDLEQSAPEGNPFWRLRGAYDLPPGKRSILLALFEWREQEAQRIDRPSFHVLSGEAMVRLAQLAPDSQADLARAGLNGRTIERWGKGILKAVKHGKEIKPPHPERNGGMDERAQIRLEALRKWRKRKAEARGVESDVILCRDALFRIAREAPATPAALRQIPGLGSYRFEAYGGEILAALNHSP
ncbi:MAG: ribonuclease D [Anaerolineales bacterium]|nr:ribonuclease D [Anaerolineales bacterium]